MLANLKVVNVVRSGNAGTDITARVRAKMLSAIDEQISSVQHAIEKKPFNTTRKVGGEERARRFRPWWFRGAGFFYTSLRYGAAQLELPGGGKAIEAGPRIEDLLKTYEHAKAAINAGELDDIILAAAAKRGRARGDKPVQQAPVQAPTSPASAPSKPAQGAGISGSARARNRG